MCVSNCRTVCGSARLTYVSITKIDMHVCERMECTREIGRLKENASVCVYIHMVETLQEQQSKMGECQTKTRRRGRTTTCGRETDL